MPCHALRQRFAHGALCAQIRPWRLTRAPFSTSTRYRSKVPTPEELIAELDAQYQQDKAFAESQADQALLSMHQYNKACSRLQTELEEITASLPLQEMKKAGIPIGRIAKEHAELLSSIREAQELTRESQDHILDMFHEPYPTLDPDPFKEYRNQWSQRKRTEQAAELKRLEGVLIADNTSLDMIWNKIQTLLVEQYGQAYVDEVNSQGSAALHSWVGSDNDIADEQLESLDEDSTQTKSSQIKRSPFQLGLKLGLKDGTANAENDETPASTSQGFNLSHTPSKDKSEAEAGRHEKRAMSLLEQFKMLAGKK